MCIAMAVVLVCLVLYMVFSKSSMTPGPGRSTGTSNHITGGNHPLPFLGSYSAGGHLADNNPEAMPGAISLQEHMTALSTADSLDREIAKARASGHPTADLLMARQAVEQKIQHGEQSHGRGVKSAADLATAGVMDGIDSTTLASILGSPCSGGVSPAALEDLKIAQAAGSIPASMTI